MAHAYSYGDDMDKHDMEKYPVQDSSYEKRPSAFGPSYIVEDDGAVPGESFAHGNTFYAKAQRFAGKFKIEQRGIERVPEYERTDTSMLNVSTMVSTYFSQCASCSPHNTKTKRASSASCSPHYNLESNAVLSHSPHWET